MQSNKNWQGFSIGKARHAMARKSDCAQRFWGKSKNPDARSDGSYCKCQSESRRKYSTEAASASVWHAMTAFPAHGYPSGRSRQNGTYLDLALHSRLLKKIWPKEAKTEACEQGFIPTTLGLATLAGEGQRKHCRVAQV